MLSYFSLAIRRSLKCIYRETALPFIKLIYRKRTSQNKTLPENCKNILVNFSDHTYVGLGDVVIYSTIIRILKHKFKDAKIVLLIGRRNKFFELYWKEHAGLDDFLIHPPLRLRYIFAWIHFIYNFNTKIKFDISIVQSIEPVRGLDSTWFPVDPAITFIKGVKNIVGFYDRWDEDCFYSYIVSQQGVEQFPPDTPGPHWTGPHWTDIAKGYARAFSIPENELDLLCKPFFYFKSFASPDISRATPRYRIALNPGGDQIWNRRWPLDKFVALCVEILDKLNAVIFLVGGPDELELRKELYYKVRDKFTEGDLVVIDVKALKDTANYIYHSDLFIGNDSGVTHLASAIGTKIIAIYGPSNFAFWGPEKLDPKNKVVSLTLPCMPCEHRLNLTGIAECHLKEDKYKCLNELEVERVYKEVVRSVSSEEMLGQALN